MENHTSDFRPHCAASILAFSPPHCSPIAHCGLETAIFNQKHSILLRTVFAIHFISSLPPRTTYLRISNTLSNRFLKPHVTKKTPIFLVFRGGLENIPWKWMTVSNRKENWGGTFSHISAEEQQRGLPIILVDVTWSSFDPRSVMIEHHKDQLNAPLSIFCCSAVF